MEPVTITSKIFVFEFISNNTMANSKRTKGQTMIQNTTQKTKDSVIRTPLKTGGELRNFRKY